MKGAYVLLMRLDEDTTIATGALGELHFRAGEYCYVGSANGPGGIEARVGRHLRKEKKKRWHIDYFLDFALISDVIVLENGSEINAARTLSGECPGIPHFGASDSPMNSHLFLCPHRRVREILPDFHPGL